MGKPGGYPMYIVGDRERKAYIYAWEQCYFSVRNAAGQTDPVRYVHSDDVRQRLESWSSEKVRWVENTLRSEGIVWKIGERVKIDTYFPESGESPYKPPVHWKQKQAMQRDMSKIGISMSGGSPERLADIKDRYPLGFEIAEKELKAKELRKEGLSLSGIAKKMKDMGYKISKTSVWKYLKRR